MEAEKRNAKTQYCLLIAGKICCRKVSLQVGTHGNCREYEKARICFVEEQQCELEQYVVNVKEHSHCHANWGFAYFILPIVK